MILPQQLESLRNSLVWVNYVLIWNPRKHGIGGYDKPPVNPHTLRNANITNPDHMADFDTCNAFIGMSANITGKSGKITPVQIAGVGIVLQEAGLVGIDLDYVVRTAPSGKTSFTQEAVDIMRRANSYTEISVSGTGIHILVKGNKPGSICRATNPDGSEYEIYDSYRYFTVSGDMVPRSPNLCENNDGIKFIYDLIASRQNRAEKGTSSLQSGEVVVIQETDAELWAKMFRSRKGSLIRRLYNGETGDYAGDASRADYALLSYIGYWCNYDYERMDRMFRQSGLMRDKWERSNYRENTLNKIIRNANIYRR